MRRSMRRLLRRPWRARGALDAMPDGPRRSLMHAHALLDAGQAADAAALLSDLASQSEGAGEARCGWIHLQAGRAWHMAGDPQQAAEHAQQALRLLGPWITPDRHARLSRRIAAELGLPTVASSLDNAPGEGSDLPPAAVGMLPPKCPQCGATVRPDEAEPLADGRAACAYCGSILIPSANDG